MNNSKLSALALAASLLAAPAFAQTATTAPSTAPATGTSAPMATTAPMSPSNTTATTAQTPAERNPVMTDMGNIRASKVIGSSVYNEQKDKVGTVDDIILGKDQKASMAVISVGGFLGIGSKLVEVPYDKLTYGNTNDSSDNRVMMPNATKQELMGMSTYSYTK